MAVTFKIIALTLENNVAGPENDAIRHKNNAIIAIIKYDNHGLFNGVNHILSIKSTKMKILNCKAVSILICKKIIAVIDNLYF